MRSAVTTEPHVIRLEDTEPPASRAGHARVAVEVVGLCGSDYHLFSGEHPYARFPQTQGHEFCGRLLELPSDYQGSLEVGDRVVVEPTVACGNCFACRRGRYNCCARLQVMGAHIPGALAEEVVVPIGAVHGAGALTADLAALVEPISIGIQAVRRGEVRAGDKVLVLGAGPIGIAAMLGARALGAEVMVVDRLVARLETATSLGAARVDDGHDLARSVLDWTGGDGAGVVLEATGAPVLLRQALDLVAPSGTIVVVGISDQEVSIPIIEFSRLELTIVGSRNSAGVFPDAVRLVAENADRLGMLITHRYDLAEVGEALRFACSNPAQVEKVLIDVGRSGP